MPLSYGLKYRCTISYLTSHDGSPSVRHASYTPRSSTTYWPSSRGSYLSMVNPVLDVLSTTRSRQSSDVGPVILKRASVTGPVDSETKGMSALSTLSSSSCSYVCTDCQRP